MFCPKCGSLMAPSKGKQVCGSCGYEQKFTRKDSESHEIVNKSGGKEVIMIREEKSAEPLDSDAVCPKCHKMGAYYLLKQTRSADEPETKFYTCSHCGHRWREY
ncbi:MAG: transcription factor S [Thermoplasmataceae archaeon]|jgi:DNA-directed RNA polymerase subunit M|nr:transcription factor S [Candidatus Thermoplasmatota archaeon]